MRRYEKVVRRCENVWESVRICEKYGNVLEGVK